MQLAEFSDPSAALIDIVEAVVGFRHAFIVFCHERGTVLIVGGARGFAGRVRLPTD